MKLLAIESSTDLAQVVLGEGENFIIKEIIGVREHARNLLRLIDESMMEAGWLVSDLEGVVFGRGPGSFTGLRVACSLAQGIAYAQDLPVYPVSSLASIVMAVRQRYPEHGVLALLDARMQQLYWTFARPEAIETEEFVTDPGHIRVKENNIIIAGKGFQSYNPFFHASLLKKENVWIEQAPCAVSMIQMVQKSVINPVSVEQALPVYVRNKVT